jgi:hypothetical protein
MLLSCCTAVVVCQWYKIYTETLIFAPGALHTQSLRLSAKSVQGKLQKLHLRDHCTFKIKLS